MFTNGYSPDLSNQTKPEECNMSDEENQEETENEEKDKDTEEGSEGEEGEGGDSSGSKKKLLIIAVGGILLLIGIGAGLYFTGMLDGLLGKGETGEHAEGGHDDGHGGDGQGGEHGEEHAVGAAFLEIPTMIVNLNTEDGTPRYLRLTVQLELENQADKAAVEAVIPRVVDQFQTYLRELRVKDLRGSAGIYRLQMELLWRVNQAAAPVEVKDVLFQEILIQ